MLTALSASLCWLIVTKANPLDSPLLRSLITSTAITWPACANSALSSSGVVDLERFPTYNLASICNTAFSGISTRRRDAVNPITGLTAVTPHKSSYLISNDWIQANGPAITWMQASHQVDQGSPAGRRPRLGQRPRQ